MTVTLPLRNSGLTGRLPSLQRQRHFTAKDAKDAKDCFDEHLRRRGERIRRIMRNGGELVAGVVVLVAG